MTAMVGGIRAESPPPPGGGGRCKLQPKKEEKGEEISPKGKVRFKQNIAGFYVKSSYRTS